MKSKLNAPSAAGLCLMIMAVTSLVAAPKNGHKEAPAPAAPAPAAHVRVVHETAAQNVHFSVENVRVIREYYAPRYRQLPPGLQKKYARTGQLPPGWQQRMEPLPVKIERELPHLPDGYRRGVIDGHAVVYNSRAGTIIDVAVLF
jgi:hypothetical protein